MDFLMIMNLRSGAAPVGRLVLESDSCYRISHAGVVHRRLILMERRDDLSETHE